MSTRKRRREDTVPKSFSEDPYHISSLPCEFGVHERRKANCKDNCNCIFGFGEGKRGIWKKTFDPNSLMNGGRHLKLREGSQPMGLKNLGGTCYFNSLLQCWFNNKAFRNSIYSLSSDSNEITNRRLYAILCMQMIFGYLQNGLEASFSPVELIDALKLSHVHQQDMHEASNLLMQAIDDCFHTCGDDDKKDIIKNLFHFRVNNSIQCKSCGYMSKGTEERSDLTVFVDAGQGSSIEENLASQFVDENLEGSNQYHCHRCDMKTNAVRRTRVATLPQTLQIQIQRLGFDIQAGRRLKLRHRLLIPSQMNLSFALDSDVEAKDDAEYDLCAVVYHLGANAACGHYFVDVWVPNSSDDNDNDEMKKEEEADGENMNLGEWWRIDDEVATPINEIFAEKQKAAAKRASKRNSKGKKKKKKKMKMTKKPPIGKKTTAKRTPAKRKRKPSTKIAANTNNGKSNKSKGNNRRRRRSSRLNKNDDDDDDYVDENEIEDVTGLDVDSEEEEDVEDDVIINDDDDEVDLIDDDEDDDDNDSNVEDDDNDDDDDDDDGDVEIIEEQMRAPHYHPLLGDQSSMNAYMLVYSRRDTDEWQLDTPVVPPNLQEQIEKVNEAAMELNDECIKRRALISEKAEERRQMYNELLKNAVVPVPQNIVPMSVASPKKKKRKRQTRASMIENENDDEVMDVTPKDKWFWVSSDWLQKWIVGSDLFLTEAEMNANLGIPPVPSTTNKKAGSKAKSDPDFIPEEYMSPLKASTNNNPIGTTTVTGADQINMITPPQNQIPMDSSNVNVNLVDISPRIITKNNNSSNSSNSDTSNIHLDPRPAAASLRKRGRLSLVSSNSPKPKQQQQLSPIIVSDDDELKGQNSMNNTRNRRTTRTPPYLPSIVQQRTPLASNTFNQPGQFQHQPILPMHHQKQQQQEQQHQHLHDQLKNPNYMQQYEAQGAGHEDMPIMGMSDHQEVPIPSTEISESPNVSSSSSSSITTQTITSTNVTVTPSPQKRRRRMTRSQMKLQEEMETRQRMEIQQQQQQQQQLPLFPPMNEGVEGLPEVPQLQKVESFISEEELARQVEAIEKACEEKHGDGDGDKEVFNEVDIEEQRRIEAEIAAKNQQSQFEEQERRQQLLRQEQLKRQQELEEAQRSQQQPIYEQLQHGEEQQQQEEQEQQQQEYPLTPKPEDHLRNVETPQQLAFASPDQVETPICTNESNSSSSVMMKKKDKYNPQASPLQVSPSGFQSRSPKHRSPLVINAAINEHDDDDDDKVNRRIQTSDDTNEYEEIMETENENDNENDTQQFDDNDSIIYSDGDRIIDNDNNINSQESEEDMEIGISQQDVLSKGGIPKEEFENNSLEEEEDDDKLITEMKEEMKEEDVEEEMKEDMKEEDHEDDGYVHIPNDIPSVNVSAVSTPINMFRISQQSTNPLESESNIDKLSTETAFGEGTIPPNTSIIDQKTEEQANPGLKVEIDEKLEIKDEDDNENVYEEKMKQEEEKEEQKDEREEIQQRTQFIPSQESSPKTFRILSLHAREVELVNTKCLVQSDKFIPILFDEAPLLPLQCRCPHNKLCPKAVQKYKLKRIPAECYEALMECSNNFPREEYWFQMSSDDYFCDDCVQELSSVEDLQKQILENDELVASNLKAYGTKKVHEGIIISKSWLKEWRSNLLAQRRLLNPPPTKGVASYFDTTTRNDKIEYFKTRNMTDDILCPHGNLTVENKLWRVLPADIHESLSHHYNPGLEFCQYNGQQPPLCEECNMVNQALLNEQQRQVEAVNNELTPGLRALLKRKQWFPKSGPNGHYTLREGYYCIISHNFLQRWRMKMESPSDVQLPPTGIDNSIFICEHGKCKLPLPVADYLYAHMSLPDRPITNFTNQTSEYGELQCEIITLQDWNDLARYHTGDKSYMIQISIKSDENVDAAANRAMREIGAPKLVVGLMPVYCPDCHESMTNLLNIQKHNYVNQPITVELVKPTSTISAQEISFNNGQVMPNGTTTTASGRPRRSTRGGNRRKKVTIYCSHDDLGSFVKLKVFERAELPSMSFSIFCKGVELGDMKTLASQDVTIDDTLYVDLKYGGDVDLNFEDYLVDNAGRGIVEDDNAGFGGTLLS